MGLGPGRLDCLTGQARQALEEAQAVVGYRTYLELAAPLLEGKQVVASAMTRELDRAGLALDLALEGQKVALVSSGDPGIYAMAAVVFELARSRRLDLRSGGLALEVVPGVPALAAAASLLGAPLSHDFACVSLSDRLTPWELIEKRLSLAAEADFVIALYNPKSKGRAWQLGRACDIIAGQRSPRTPVGVVRKALRQGQSLEITDLAGAPQADIDMQTLLIVGNSQSFTYQGRLVTPRGYIDKYGEK